MITFSQKKVKQQKNEDIVYSDYVSKIKEETNYQDSAIVFYKSKDIEEISNLSGMRLNSNEYQVHYIGLVMIQKHSDGSKELTIFPIAYYNYPQEVTGSTIDVDMPDVAKKASEIQVIAMIAAKQLMEKLQTAFPNQELEFHLSLFNNIHRHP